MESAAVLHSLTVEARATGDDELRAEIQDMVGQMRGHLFGLPELADFNRALLAPRWRGLESLLAERWRRGLLALALVAFPAWILFSGEETSKKVLFKDDFSKANATLRREGDNSHEILFRAGALLIVAVKPHTIFAMDPATRDALASLRINVDAAALESPALDKARTLRDYYGVSCFSSRASLHSMRGTSGYLFLVNSRGRFRISRESGYGTSVLLREGAAPPGLVKPLSYPNHIRAECVSHGRRSMHLRLTINGRELAEFEDRAPMRALHGALLLASSSAEASPSVTLFDNLVMETTRHKSGAESALGPLLLWLTSEEESREVLAGSRPRGIRAHLSSPRAPDQL